MAHNKKRQTRLAYEVQARRAKGILRNFRWASSTVRARETKCTDEDGELDRSSPISRQRMVLRCSPSRHAQFAEEMGDIVYEAAREHAVVAADGTSLSKRSREDYDRALRSPESWVLSQLKYTARIRAMNRRTWISFHLYRRTVLEDERFNDSMSK